jgi:hypothetical protein
MLYYLNMGKGEQTFISIETKLTRVIDAFNCKTWNPSNSVLLSLLPLPWYYDVDSWLLTDSNVIKTHHYQQVMTKN